MFEVCLGFGSWKFQDLLLRAAYVSISHPLLGLTARNDEVIIVAVAPPRSRRHVTDFGKLPIGHVGRRKSQVIAHGRGNIQPGAVIEIRFGALISEDVLKMVSAKWAAVLPLSITSAIAFTNSEPTVPAYRLSLPCIGLFEPRNHERRFRLKLAMRDIVIRQRAVERILFRNKRHRNVIAPRARLGVIVSPVIRRPIKVPGTSIVGDRIIASGLFSNPKHCGDNVRLPRITLDRWTGTRRDKNLRLHFE